MVFHFDVSGFLADDGIVWELNGSVAVHKAVGVPVVSSFVFDCDVCVYVLCVVYVLNLSA